MLISLHDARAEVLIAVLTNVSVFWDVTQFQKSIKLSALPIPQDEGIDSFETSVILISRHCLTSLRSVPSNV
jgi:hypothetical protein